MLSAVLRPFNQHEVEACYEVVMPATIPMSPFDFAHTKRTLPTVPQVGQSRTVLGAVFDCVRPDTNIGTHCAQTDVCVCSIVMLSASPMILNWAEVETCYEMVILVAIPVSPFDFVPS